MGRREKGVESLHRYIVASLSNRPRLCRRPAAARRNTPQPSVVSTGPPSKVLRLVSDTAAVRDYRLRGLAFGSWMIGQKINQ